MAILGRIGDALECRYDGQRLRIDPWGRDSLRVREVPMGEILDTDFALLPPVETSAEITIGEDGRMAELTNGKIRVVVSDNGQGCELHFLNQDGKTLLRDQPYGWALRKRCAASGASKAETMPSPWSSPPTRRKSCTAWDSISSGS